MKNAMKCLAGLLLAWGCSSVVGAASMPVSPKDSVLVSNYSTACSTITVIPSTNAVANAAYMPGAIYEINMSTGASAEYVVFYDTNTCLGISTGTTAGMVGSRFMYGSATASTQWKLDPPLAFYNGLCACDSAITGQASITYEFGRGLSGQ